MYIYNVYIYIDTNLLVIAIVRQPYPWRGDSQGQETFLVHSADKQICNYDTKALKPPSLSTKLKVKRIEQ